MKILYKLLIVMFSLVVISGCSSPTGTIDVRNGNGDLLWAVPNRQIYNLDNIGEDRFNRESDLQIFTSFRGMVENVPDYYVDIFVVEDPSAEDPEFIPVNGNGNGNGNRSRNGNGSGGAGIHLFESAGRKVIVVNFMDMETHYSIEVLGNGYNGSGGSGSGVNINWY